MIYSIYDLTSQKLNPKHQKRNQSLGQLHSKTVLENIVPIFQKLQHQHLVEVKSQKSKWQSGPNPERTLGTLEGHDTHRHEERKKEMVPLQGRKRTSNIPLTFWRWLLLLFQDFPTPRLNHRVLILGLPVYMTVADRQGEKRDNTGNTWLEERWLQHIKVQMSSHKCYQGEKRFVRWSLSQRSSVLFVR